MEWKKWNILKVASIYKYPVLQSICWDRGCNVEFHVTNIFVCIFANKDAKHCSQ